MKHKQIRCMLFNELLCSITLEDLLGFKYTEIFWEKPSYLLTALEKAMEDAVAT